MNKLQKDIIRHRRAMIICVGLYAIAGLASLITNLLGLKEKEIGGPWGSTILGVIFAVTLVYTAKKSVDIHPNIQLRSKSDDFLKRILTDSEYERWHPEAQRLLDHRKTKGCNPKPEIPRWISWPLLGIMYLLAALVLVIIVGASIACLIG